MRPDIAGSMGAFGGAALLARGLPGGHRPRGAARPRRGRLVGSEFGAAEAPSSRFRACCRSRAAGALAHAETVRCKRAPNHCLLTVNDFGVDATSQVSTAAHHGQPLREEARARSTRARAPCRTSTSTKSQRLFGYRPLAPRTRRAAQRGHPRSASAGYRSGSRSSEAGLARGGCPTVHEEDLQAGIESMPSRSVCYPAKLSHDISLEPAGRHRLHLVPMQQVEPEDEARATS